MPAASLPAATLGLWTVMTAFVIGMGLSHAPFTLYDSPSYHLFFPARWLQAHHLSIIPTPFSDEAQAYQPANGELWLLWLMVPFHGDFVARIGQAPFYALAAAGVYALARRMGAAATHALYAPTFLLVAPPIVEQAIGANVDLIHASLFVTSLYLGIAALESDARRDWGLFGISVGLWLGSKYLALVYVPVLAFALIVRGLRPRRSGPPRASPTPGRRTSGRAASDMSSARRSTRTRSTTSGTTCRDSRSKTSGRNPPPSDFV